MHPLPPFVIGIAGGSGSGKTTLARILAQELPWHVLTVELDQFYKDLSYMPLEERLDVNFDHPDSLDFDAITAVVHELRAGDSTEVPVYDFATCTPTDKRRTIFPSHVILVEGMQVLHHTPLAEQFDVSIFLDIPEEIRFYRKLDRDVRERGRTYQNVIDMWNTRTKPMHGTFVQPSSEIADLVYTHTTIDQIICDVSALVQQYGVPESEKERKNALSQFTATLGVSDEPDQSIA